MGNSKSKEKSEKPEKSFFNEMKEANININSVSSNTLDEIIDKLIINKDVNMTYLPDAVERQIYRNLLVYFFGILKEVIRSSKIEFFNHEITFTINVKK